MILPDGVASPLRLSAVTLRGIGPYIEGARLELRPLTIICGTNGSGKSTWFKALKLVNASLGSPWFPFRLASDRDPYFYWGHVNKAVLDSFLPDPLAKYTTNAQSPLSPYARADSDAEEKYGLIGTIGLEIQGVGSFDLPGVGTWLDAQESQARMSAAQRFFFHGRIAEEETYTIRFTSFPRAVKRLSSSEEEQSHAHEKVELLVGGKSIFCFDRGPGEDGYRYFCSPDLALGMPKAGGDLFGYVHIGDESKQCFAIEPMETGRSGQQLEEHCRLAIDRIKQLTAVALEGYFPVGAIRLIDAKGYADASSLESCTSNAAIKGRHVGEEGQNASGLLFNFADNVLWDSHEPYSGPVEATLNPILAHQVLGELFSKGEAAAGHRRLSDETRGLRQANHRRDAQRPRCAPGDSRHPRRGDS